MTDFFRKEEITAIKLNVLGILNMVLEDELYSKEMMVTDLTNLVAILDEMDDSVKKSMPEI